MLRSYGAMIRRAGTELFNFHLLEDGGRVTIVDAGLPRFRRTLDADLRAIGRTIEDVEAIVLTHAHIDHVGFAERARRELGVPVWVPPIELCTDNAAMIASAARFVEPVAYPHYLALDAYASSS